MSRLRRLAGFAVGAAALPSVALLLGARALHERERPEVLPRLDAAAVARVPRPAIDPTMPTVVVLLGRDVTEITDALGPYEMFARAGRFNVVMAAAERQPTWLTGGLRILPHYSLAELDAILGGAAEVVVVPNLPTAGDPVNRPVIEWIGRQAAAGALIHSWCKGAMALAEAGLLDGRTATAHWGDIPSLARRYPRVTWVRGVRWVDHGQLVMSAGITSGIDASLRVLIRLAGEGVARRVAREIRYPTYRFALDPTVEPHHFGPADLVLLANAAFRLRRPRLGVALYDGVGELDLSNAYDAHVHTMVVRAETLAERDGPVVTAHGVTVYPSLTVVSHAEQTGVRPRLPERAIVPGGDARQRAVSLVSALREVQPEVRLQYLHAGQPERFGLAPALEDLARTADLPTARFALKRMELRSNDLHLEGSAVPWVPLGTALALAGIGLVVSRASITISRRNAFRLSDRSP